ncbi:hypothetical protein [uncultured Brachyspira sp.]|uniref:hypothetical protein n=1 Tax=uncultured Brachyspira sp. TaxID=221953 RepID=UPI0025D914DC|nr:hypothetical protein [uncultured Brachyspira sp.]
MITAQHSTAQHSTAQHSTAQHFYFKKSAVCKFTKSELNYIKITLFLKIIFGG